MTGSPVQNAAGRPLLALYSGLLGVGLLVSAPWWLMRMATTARYREGLRERLGQVPRRLVDAVRDRQVVWVHAVSVGEVLAVSHLVEELEAALSAGQPAAAWRVVISTTTRTGQALARQRFGADRVFYYPLDFAWTVRAYLGALRPKLVVLAESELWPRLLHECGRAGIPVAVVNARVSDRSFRRSLQVRGLWRRMMGGVSRWLAQSEQDARRLLVLGAGDETVTVSGNLKYDLRPPQRSRVAESLRQIAGQRPVLVAGSTVRSGNGAEESAVIRAWASELRSRGVLLVLAPRHPENFAAVYAMVTKYPRLLATELLQGKAGADDGSVRIPNGERRPVEVIVLDTIGDLAAAYGVADVAFVGGSLVKHGGHNPLEPARFGVPVLMGPSFENFREIVTKMVSDDGLLIVQDEADLAAALRRMFSQPDLARAVGARARQVYEREGGATLRSIEALMSLLDSGQGTPSQEEVPA